jgi:hypothetical protein
LRALRDDLALVKGNDDEETCYVGELLERLRSANPG